uniref:Pre-mRNA-splicing factor SPF27 n=1 Tax=Echinostoma caproni TaxID=27848 RepID=A0A183A3I5_9TREM
LKLCFTYFASFGVLSGTMNTEYVGVVDALPYFDKGYDDPGIREAAALLVEEEMKRYRPTKNYLEHLPSLSGPVVPKFETEMIKAEFDRLSNRLPMELLSMKRYELPPPPAGKMTDVKAWQDAVENAEAQLEHQATRIKNLELMAQYGCNAWKQYNNMAVLLLIVNVVFDPHFPLFVVLFICHMCSFPKQKLFRHAQLR